MRRHIHARPWLSDRDRGGVTRPAGWLAGADGAGYILSMTKVFADPAALTHDQLEEGSAFAPKFDAHGLVTAVAQEAGSGRVLMVAHMNAEALARTIETGEIHYYSRSRGRIWKKGETSGEVQKLVGLAVDCDQDTLLLTVEQTGRGAACHTGRKSCFYRVLKDGKLVDSGEPRLFDPKQVYGAQ